MPYTTFIAVIAIVAITLGIPTPGHAATMTKPQASTTILDELSRLRSGVVANPLLEPARIALRDGRYDAVITAVEAALPKLDLPADKSAAQDLMGAALQSKRDTAGAIAALRRAIRLDPTSSVPMVRLGTIYLLENQLEDARRVLQQAVTVDPQSRLAHRQLGYVLAETNNIDGAIESLGRGLGPPDDAAVRVDLAALLNQRLQFAAAAELLRPVIYAQSKDPRGLQQRAIAEAGAGNRETGLTLIMAARALVPNDEGIVTTVGVIERANGRIEKSLATLQAAAKAYPRSAAVQYELALTLVSLSKPEEAQAALVRAQELNPDALIIRRTLAGVQAAGDQPDAGLGLFADLAARPQAKQADFYALATAYQFAGRDNEAEKAFRDATLRFPNDAGVWWKLGAMIAQRGRYEDALTPLNRALTLAPRDTRILRTISLAEMRLGRVANAITTAEMIVSIEPRNADAKFMLGDMYEQNRRWDKALAVYQDIQALQPNHPVILNNLASVMTELNRAREAVPLARKAAELLPNSASAADTLGWALLQAGDTKAAVVALQKARDLESGDPRRLYRLAVAEARSGNRDTARRNLETALATDTPFADKEKAQALLTQLRR